LAFTARSAALIRRKFGHPQIEHCCGDNARMGRDVRERPGRPGRCQLKVAASADHEPLLDRMRQDALRRAGLGNLVTGRAQLVRQRRTRQRFKPHVRITWD
jgi:hypothetical protein